jgi:hypothetical protein
MDLFSNATIRHGRIVVRNEVDVELCHDSNDESWGGKLLPPNNIGLMYGETYTLMIPGCSAAKVTITSEANPNDGAVQFRGVGDYPQARPQGHSKTAR